jgi:hypothetical protein
MAAEWLTRATALQNGIRSAWGAAFAGATY